MVNVSGSSEYRLSFGQRIQETVFPPPKDFKGLGTRLSRIATDVQKNHGDENDNYRHANKQRDWFLSQVKRARGITDEERKQLVRQATIAIDRPTSWHIKNARELEASLSKSDVTDDGFYRRVRGEIKKSSTTPGQKIKLVEDLEDRRGSLVKFRADEEVRKEQVMGEVRGLLFEETLTRSRTGLTDTDKEELRETFAGASGEATALLAHVLSTGQDVVQEQGVQLMTIKTKRTGSPIDKYKEQLGGLQKSGKITPEQGEWIDRLLYRNSHVGSLPPVYQ